MPADSLETGRQQVGRTDWLTRLIEDLNNHDAFFSSTTMVSNQTPWHTLCMGSTTWQDPHKCSFCQGAALLVMRFMCFTFGDIHPAGLHNNWKHRDITAHSQQYFGSPDHTETGQKTKENFTDPGAVRKIEVRPRRHSESRLYTFHTWGIQTDNSEPALY